MSRRTGLKQITILVLVLFTWFSLYPQYQAVKPGDTAADKLKSGKESYEMGDYEKSIKLLEEYAADLQAPREKRAEAYYFLARNYDAVDPGKVKEMLLKAFETDWFLIIDEKDAYFKKMSEEVRQEFLSQIQEDKLLKRAEEAFNQGKYDLAQYFYRLLAQKQPGQTFDSEIKRNEETQTQKKQALTLYEENKYPATYIALKALLKVSPEDKETKSIISSIESQKIQPMIETGNKYFNEKNYKEAIPFFEEVLTFIPGDQEIKGKLTACREMMEKEKAASIIKEGKKIKKKFPLIPVLIGIVGVSVIAYFLLKKKSPKTGSINIISNPNGAVIWLDNVNTENTTPATLNSIASGSHTVKLVKAGYQEYTKNITVERGKVTQVNATLTPIPEITTSSVNIQIPEGNQTSFEVWLSENPPANVTLTISKESGDPDITVLSGSSLIFSPDTGKNHQIVTLAAASDDDTDNGTAIFKIHADGNFGILDKNITAVEQDAGSKGVLTVTPAERFFSTGKQAGPFLPASKTYILQNTGKGAINWTAAKTVDWITLSGGIGTLPTGGYTTVIVSLNENVNTLTQGNYSDTISFINNTNGLGTTTRLVDLQVTAPTDIPPTVSIQSPANSATVYGTVSIQVTAVDDHGVNKVEIYIDGTFFTSLINSPYIYQWNTISIANGSHTIIAKAYDTINQTNEAQVNITVSNSTMTLTPADNFSSGGFAGGPFSPSTYSYTLSNSGPNTIQWTLANTKNWLTLSSTVGELSSGESIIVSVTINENANTLVTGVYTDTLTFINSTNGNGNTSRSVSLQVNTDNLPTVSIQSPTNGAIVNGTVNIQVQATDDRGINKVEILIDNTLAATLTTSPYIYSWNTTAVANGSHTIKAFAYDTINQKKDVQVGVTVTN